MLYEDAVSRCWLEVNLDAIAENYANAKKMLGENAVAVPVLKANAYGMNAVVIAKFLKELGARLFAVATTDEAEQLLRNVDGIEVLPMGIASKSAAVHLIKAGMPLTVYSEKSGRMILDAAREANIPARVHIKVDTGLHRIGFEPEEAAMQVKALCEGGWIKPVGLYTHLAIHTAEMDHIQVKKLRMVRDELASLGINVPFVHAVDSIGMARYPDEHLSAARIGAWIYGVGPKNASLPCRSCAEFKARISQIRKVKKGELIGYDDDHPLERDSVIASISAGYVDGTPRIGRNWQVEIRGRRADVIGLACMDQMMADITDIPDAEEGDEVIFIGGGISLEEYAHMGAMNHNGALACIGRRVPRVYYRNNEIVHISTEI
ncbi:MAG: alanine racemase [Clostridia bacterium]|nr:alanine racemase [Clostridia bacterium]